MIPECLRYTWFYSLLLEALGIPLSYHYKCSVNYNQFHLCIRCPCGLERIYSRERYSKDLAKGCKNKSINLYEIME